MGEQYARDTRIRNSAYALNISIRFERFTYETRRSRARVALGSSNFSCCRQTRARRVGCFGYKTRVGNSAQTVAI